MKQNQYVMKALSNKQRRSVIFERIKTHKVSPMTVVDFCLHHSAMVMRVRSQEEQSSR